MKTYQNEHVTVTVEKGARLLRQTWVGLPTSGHYQRGSLMSVAFTKQYAVNRWLIDLRQLRIFNPIDIQWFVQQCLPALAGCWPKNTKIAVLLNNANQFAKLGTDIVLKAAMATNQTLASRYFLDNDDARYWLMNDY
ncbi:hypothetical protein ACFSUS_00825 [Spirosoma soli]|uniref:STAS/SEC14 domain-containing protein n=1 Tax=Spirosoma soli TaxID=1770529 RepID=A0ABW5LX04_9BACT